MEKHIDINQLLKAMVDLKASDLHLTAGSAPMYRINGELRPLDAPKLTPQQTQDMMLTLMPSAKRQHFDEIGTADFSYTIMGTARFRVNIYHQRGSISMAIRLVQYEIPEIDTLNLPDVVQDIALFERGLVLVTGPTGTGKTTTLASMIKHINNQRRRHIITIEDPIEYLHRHAKSIVNQIEVGVDLRDIHVALKHVLRQDPDVILFGELRDAEQVKVVLSATETGHLVFATLHTSNARHTINRILNLFPPDEEKLILQELSSHLKAVICQWLVRSSDKKTRIPVCEILINTPIAGKLISEGRIDELNQVIQNQEDGMQTFQQGLVQLTLDQKITEEEALQYVTDVAAFKRAIRGRFSGGDRRAIIG